MPQSAIVPLMGRARVERRTATLLILVALVMVVSAVPASAARTCRDRWERVDAPEPYPGGTNGLSEVAAFARDDAWAVGTATDDSFAFDDDPSPSMGQ